MYQLCILAPKVTGKLHHVLSVIVVNVNLLFLLQAHIPEYLNNYDKFKVSSFIPVGHVLNFINVY